MSKVEDRVHDVVEQVVRERLAGAAVQRVVVSRDRDHDGDEIFRVVVVLDDKSRLRPTMTISLIRHLRDALDRIGETAFPITRVLTKKDFELIRHGSR